MRLPRVAFAEVARPVFRPVCREKIALAFFAHPETGAMVDRWIVERNVSESTGFDTCVIVD